MSKNPIPVIKFLFKEELKVLGDALNIGPGFNVEEFSNSNDLSTYLSTVPAGLVVTSLYDRNDLIQIATFMKLGKKIAKDCSIKIVVFNFSKDRNFEKAIGKLGILDLVEPNINTKALKFKIDFWMKSLNAQVKNSSAANPQKVKSLEQAKAADKKAAETGGINWQEPLELEDDIWLLKHDNDCKKVLSKWLIRLLGPSPYVAQWVEVKSGLWRFDFKETEKDMFVPNEGAWFFAGDQKPEFVWKENVWLISGDNFDLYFKNSKETLSRLQCKNKSISVCKNSMFAKTKEEVIIESFDKELVFKREAEKLEDLEGKNQTDELAGNLQGKNKTDEIDNGHLQGKNKSPADRSGNMTGKMEGQDAINQENLEQKTSTSKEKSHWQNKNSYEEEQKGGNLGVNAEKHRAGENLERENKDHEHKKYYKNHNEAEKYEAGEVGKGLAGKSSTDQLESHYDNSKDRQNAQAPAERNKDSELGGKGETDKLKSHYGRKDGSESSAEKDKPDLDGKSSTDKLQSHYGKSDKESPASGAKDKDKATSPQAERERQEKEFKEKALREKENRDKNLPESQSREKASRETSASDKEGKGLGGKGSTDKIDSHYGKSQKGETTPKEYEGEKDLEASPRERFERERKSAEAQEREKKKREEAEAGWEHGHRKEDPYTRSRKNEASDTPDQSQKTATDKNWEGEHDFGFKKEDEKNSGRGGEVLPLNKTRDERNKPKTAEEIALDKITQDAKVIALLTQKGKKVTCGLDDFFENSIIFHTEDLEIENNSEINLDLKFKFMDKDTNLKINGNVTTIEDDGEGHNFVTVELSKENTVAFEAFMKLFEIRQNNISEFMKKAKGA